MIVWNQLGLQEAASPVILQLTAFHDHAFLVLTLVITLIGYATFALLLNNFKSRTTLEAQEIETIWTILPAITLLFLALPSLRLLYLIDEVNDPSLTIKTIGHQWYWSYEYSDFVNIEFDSYIIPTSNLEKGIFRLLEVDNRTVIPINTEIRLIVTAADVIHSWAVPRIGVKADAIPGRLNQIGFFITKPGVYYGQCSEICGANHSFIPICLEVVDINSFNNWTSSYNSYRISLLKYSFVKAKMSVHPIYDTRYFFFIWSNNLFILFKFFFIFYNYIHFNFYIFFLSYSNVFFIFYVIF